MTAFTVTPSYDFSGVRTPERIETAGPRYELAKDPHFSGVRTPERIETIGGSICPAKRIHFSGVRTPERIETQPRLPRVVATFGFLRRANAGARLTEI